jgi:hypothetical protein
VKKLSIVVAAAALCSGTASAQVEVVPGRAYELQLDIVVREVNPDGTGVSSPSTPMASPLPRSQYTVVRTKGDSVVIRFWQYNENTQQAEYKAFNYNTATNRTRYFIALRSEISAVSVPFHARSRWPTVSAGALLIPIKMRRKPFDFSKDITLGPSIALRWRTTNRVDQFISLVGSFGLTSVQLDSASTEGQVRQPLDVSAVTPALGLVYEVDNFQFGAFVGWDMISDNRRSRWEYQGDRWFSIGLGYSILSRSSTNQALSGKQQ